MILQLELEFLDNQSYPENFCHRLQWYRQTLIGHAAYAVPTGRPLQFAGV